MDDDSAAVASTFVERFGDGAFDEADELVHPDGPMEGAGDAAMIFSLVLTDFIVTLLLRSVPTEVTETTTIEEGPTRASVAVSATIAGVQAPEALVELRRHADDDAAPRAARDGDWRVWNVDTDR
ncbi:hypothetical protein ACFQDG_14525 [Natronoarchaeum mannanilyticum]|uniref:Uncharacterized protein n=1 Tax=Natronoarchaeum mannanilyticum TaxID=926360 RepID=A0AAV3TB73_9EURY